MTSARFIATSLRETTGPTNLLLDEIADGEYLKREGNKVVGGPGGGGGGGGGSVDDVTSGSAAIDISPTTGHVVVSLDESELENGGSQEISIAGLSGQAADGQRASALVTSGADVVVSAAAPPTAGDVLTASTSTTVLWAPIPGVRSNKWARPITPHANDVEFDSATLPSAWKLFRQSDNTDQTGSILSGCSVFGGSPPGTGTCRVEAGQAARPSHLLLQPYSGAVEQWIYAFPITLGSSHVFRASISSIMRLTGLIDNNESTILFGVYAQVSSKPGVANKVEIGYESDSHVMNIEAIERGNSLGTLADISGGAFFMDEVFIVLHSGQYWLFVTNRGQSTLVGEVAATTAGVTTGSTVWVGFRFMDVGTSRTFSTVFGVDYYRQSDNAAVYVG